MRRAVAAMLVCVVVLVGWAVLEAQQIGWFRMKTLASAAKHDVTRWVMGDDRHLTVADQPIICWGDSLTAGFGTSSFRDFPGILEHVFGRATMNYGIPKETSEQIKDRFLNRQKVEGPEFAIIWAGRNDSWLPDQVLRNVDAMVSSLNPGSKYLVLGVTTSDKATEHKGGEDYALITHINDTLAQRYGSRFVPIQDILLSQANSRFAEDVRNVAEGTIPRSLRSDHLHLNDAGSGEVAVAVQHALVANGW